MEFASVCFSRPYLVNAPLTLDPKRTNEKAVTANKKWCKDLLESSHDYLPKEYNTPHPSSYYESRVANSVFDTDRTSQLFQYCTIPYRYIYN